jgi:hypothetical protein
MQRICLVAAAMVGLSLTLGVAPSWAQRPPTNDTSDNMGNTAGGTGALTSITTGGANTAYGNAALRTNTTGFNNTAVGLLAISFSNTGNNNTGIGNSALEINEAGNNNTAVGNLALNSIASTDNNTAIGASALTNSTGSDNSAVGLLALGKSTTGNGNTAIGENALAENTTGSNNIAIGLEAGAKLTSGSDNIYLGAESAVSEAKTMRLGQDQTHTFVAGIAGHPLIGSQVVVTSAGQLGIVASSARFKRDIQAMGEGSQGLLQLRPVTFRYKQDPQGTRQYGLIAEEVAKVYPELVTRGRDGKVASVQYHELIPMLLNELQRQQREFQELKAALTARVTQLEAAVPRSASLASR